MPRQAEQAASGSDVGYDHSGWGMIKGLPVSRGLCMSEGRYSFLDNAGDQVRLVL